MKQSGTVPHNSFLGINDVIMTKSKSAMHIPLLKCVHMAVHIVLIKIWYSNMDPKVCYYHDAVSPVHKFKFYPFALPFGFLTLLCNKLSHNKILQIVILFCTMSCSPSTLQVLLFC